MFLKAAEMLDLAPKECFVVEDAYAGIDSAKAGGFVAVAVGDATSYEKADYRLNKISDILKILT